MNVAAEEMGNEEPGVGRLNEIGWLSYFLLCKEAPTLDSASR